MTVTLPPDAERLLRERATREGLSLEKYLERIAAREAAAITPPTLDDDFEVILNRLAALGAGLPVQAGKLDRSELYTDHD